MLALLALAALACLLGLVDQPSEGPQTSTGAELLDLIRVLCTAALAVTLMLGPGVLWRAVGGRPIALGFLALPGLAILATIGGITWALGESVDPRTFSLACCAPLLGLMLGALIAAGPEDLLDREEQRALAIVALALIVAIAKSLWSLGPVGEWFGGTISRTLSPEGRPDSRISYHVVQLIANGSGPYSSSAEALFAPYNFSSRGPLPGMAATPLALLSGTHPQLTLPEQPWRPFDAQGFMAFRIAMISFSCSVFLALWELVKRLGGIAAARFALLLGVSTPFIFADLWFTWPKLLAAAFVLLAAIWLIERKSFRSGLLVGVGFLAHPSALGGLFALGPISLWPIRGASWRRPQILSALLLLAGTAIAVFFWREINGPHLRQDQFFEYVKQAYPHYDPSVTQWVGFRLRSLANTLVPLFLPLVDGHNVSINVPDGTSPGVVHFFFQYWTGVPFGFGIVFLPMMAVSLWRALRRWTWAIVATIVLPFLAFAVYWGASSSGMLREGMQAWVLAVIAVIALQQASAGFSWFRSVPARVVLVLRAAEVLALAVGATLGTHRFDPLGAEYRLDDVASLLALVAATAAIAWLVWSGTTPREAPTSGTDRVPGP
jgi:hypothetical protein